ncbi:transglutaminase domain-containing protein [Fibrisoma montanum]|uniref:Transglutaminase domain-containing protein n=2 Tax=Fibrisoma montanum TaxID=2305895 RepID=A0A418MCL0_9BACT|nr:transglutaminase domain-containing protein [Fibrisoma montanum]
MLLPVLLSSRPGTEPPRERSVAVTYTTVVKDIPAGTKTMQLWVPIPRNSPYQQITDLVITSPYPYEIDTGRFGNRMLHLTLKNPEPTIFTVDVRFNALRKEHIQERLYTQNATGPMPTDPDMGRWLQPDRLVPIDGNIKRWSREIIDSVGAKTDLEKARAIYNHVISTVKYDKTGTGWGRGDIYYACDTRRGNCTDFHAMFIGYARAAGIPARFAIGVSLPTDRPSGEIGGYHCWAECYLTGIGWVPIDASEAAKNPAKRGYYFGAHDENRIEFTMGRDLSLYPGQKEPLNYFIYPYAEADGKPMPIEEKHIQYRDLNTTDNR